MSTTERRSVHKIGKRLAEGPHLRFLPPVELPWITTFNLRWWRHLADKESRRVDKPAGKAGIPG